MRRIEPHRTPGAPPPRRRWPWVVLAVAATLALGWVAVQLYVAAVVID